MVTASPRPLHNCAKVVNGPAWYPKAARVRPITWVMIKGWRMRAVFVPEVTNDGSAFAHHVVLIWTVARHTYGVGFHDTRGVRETLLLDEELARHITLVGPDAALSRILGCALLMVSALSEDPELMAVPTALALWLSGRLTARFE